MAPESSFLLEAEGTGTSGKENILPWFLPETRARNHSFGVFFKWFGPMFLAGFFQVIVMLIFGRIATYMYVQEMLYEVKYRPLLKNATKPPFETSAHYLPVNVSYGSLNDPVQDQLGWHKVPLTVLDALAAIFPACFVFSAIFLDELKIWTHVMMSNALLAFGKGLFEVMTIIPDSIGWRDCQIRLGEEGVKWHSEQRGFLELVLFEVKKYFGGLKVRYCADMLWSGHTYVVTLYALGLFELCRRQTKSWEEEKRICALLLVGLIAVVQQTVEIYFILENRFHYTIDIAMAVLMTFLIYSNGAVATSAKSWVRWHETKRSAHFAKDEFVILKVKLSELESDGEVIIPPCCLPFCCLQGQQHIFSDDDMVKLVDGIMEVQHLQPDAQTMDECRAVTQRYANASSSDQDTQIQTIDECHKAMVFHVLDNMAISTAKIDRKFSQGKEKFEGDLSNKKKCALSKMKDALPAKMKDVLPMSKKKADDSSR